MHDQADRDAIASSLLHYRDKRATTGRHHDFLTMCPEARWRVARLLGEIVAVEGW
jgi:hypothetical protein